MSKKVKCAECEHMMTFATPKRVDADNYEYAKHCLEVVKMFFICGWTEKQKLIGNEQYCKYFLRSEHDHSRLTEERIRKLEDAIAEYEKKLKI